MAMKETDIQQECSNHSETLNPKRGNTSVSVNLTTAQTPVYCDKCENDVPGEYYCKECKETLCPQCEKRHGKLNAGHNVVSRSQVGDVDKTTLSCGAEHGDQAIVHCETCNIPVCIKCVTGNHQGHKMVDLAEIFEKKRKLLQNNMDEIQDFLPKLERKIEDIESEKENYEMKVLQITKDMEAENKSLHEELDRIHNERLKSLNSIRQSHLLLFNGCTTTIKKEKEVWEKRKSEYQDAIGKNSLPAVIKFAHRIEPLPDLGSKPELPEPPVFVPRNVQKMAENLVKLQLSYPSLEVQPLKQTTPTIISKFKSPVEGIPSICITKEGDAWLGGMESRELVMVDIKGTILGKKSIQNRPHTLAATESGDIIISNHPDYCTSVGRLPVDSTAKQQLLICTKEGRVARSSSDGTDFTQLYKGPGQGSAVFAVEDEDGNIYISDKKTPAIVIVSRSGKLLSKITHTTGGQKLGAPLGLAVDKMGNILCADKKNHCVYIIDHNQQVRELVGRKHGIQQPRQLAVDNDNNLWITQLDGTIIVLKYLA